MEKKRNQRKCLLKDINQSKDGQYKPNYKDCKL